MIEQGKPTLEQLIGFAQRSADDAWLNSNTHTAEMFAAIAEALKAAGSPGSAPVKGGDSPDPNDSEGSAEAHRQHQRGAQAVTGGSHPVEQHAGSPGDAQGRQQEEQEMPMRAGKIHSTSDEQATAMDKGR